MCPVYVVPCCICILMLYTGEAKSKLDEEADQHDFLIISLDGKTVEQFSEIQPQFRDFIAALAKSYCKENDIQNYGIINSSRVEIHRVERCPVEWPESDLCIKVNMSVPVSVNSSESYQLSVKSLQSMWKTRSDDQLKELGLKEYNVPSSYMILILWLIVTGILFLILLLQEYNVPSSYTILILWLIVTGILFLFFFIILICAVRTRFVENYLRRKDILGSSNRSWVYGEKQLVPPFFYPEPPSTKLEETHIKYDMEASLRKRSIGIENPAYLHDASSRQVLAMQISQTTTSVDSFDSDEETVYPPAPLPRPMVTRNEKRRKDLQKDSAENETEL